MGFFRERLERPPMTMARGPLLRVLGYGLYATVDHRPEFHPRVTRQGVNRGAIVVAAELQLATWCCSVYMLCSRHSDTNTSAATAFAGSALLGG